MNNNEDVVFLSRVIKEEDITPIFKVTSLFCYLRMMITLSHSKISSVTGMNLDLFSNFLNLLPVNNQLLSNKNLHTEVSPLTQSNDSSWTFPSSISTPLTRRVEKSLSPAQ